MIKKILVIRLSSMGDVIFTTPLIRALKMQKDYELHYLVKGQFAPILKSNPYIDRLHIYTDNIKTILKDLKTEDFDLVIDLHNSIRSRIISFELRKPVRRFNKINFLKWLRIKLNLDFLPRRHVVDRCFDAVSDLGIENDGAGMDFFFDHKEICSELWSIIPNNYVVIALGASHQTKRIPRKVLLSIIEKYKGPIVCLGGSDVVDLTKGIESIHAANELINLVGKTSIEESAHIIKNSKLVISPDSGMLHLAAALQTPTLSIWGSTIPEFGVFPYYGEREVKHLIFENKDLKCRPCSKHGGGSCPKNHFRCMNEIDTKQLVGKMHGLIE